MIREMADLGFGHVELSHGIRISLVPGVLKAVEEGVARVSSAHNFCPLPAGVLQAAPNLFEPSTSDPGEHFQWVRNTRRSIDFAAQVGARVLVCHLGEVRFFLLSPAARIGRYLRRRPEANPATDPAYRDLLTRCMERLRRRMGPPWERAKASVREIIDYAGEKGIKLGLENREKFEELPLDADLPGLLGGLAEGAAAGYWHDTGHAQLKQNMGLISHREHLEKNAALLIGFHLHDVNAEGRDHQAVGTGRVDFEMVSGFWRPEHLLTIELSPRAGTRDVIASKERVEALIGARGWA
jgi:sugar phosphate isomerase/epimerase